MHAPCYARNRNRKAVRSRACKNPALPELGFIVPEIEQALSTPETSVQPITDYTDSQARNDAGEIIEKAVHVLTPSLHGLGDNATTILTASGRGSQEWGDGGAPP